MATDNHLTEDMIVEILCRLPVKSLLRFKCVCQTWYTLIRSPVFITQHLCQSKKNVFPLLCDVLDFGWQEYVISLIYTNKVACLNLSDPLRSLRCVSIVGTCNGLVCVKISPQIFFMWNPATKMVRRLPEAKLMAGFYEHAYIGFIYLPSTKDYILVRVLLRRQIQKYSRLRVISTRVEVFTTSTNFWRKTQPDLLPCYIDVDVVIGNRCFYWMGYDSYDSEKSFKHSFVFSFDMKEEKFRQIVLPFSSDFDGSGTCSLKLAAFKESLAMFIFCTYQQSDTGFDVWIMDDSNGRHDSWVKRFTVGSMSITGSRPLGFWLNGALVFYASEKGRMFLYDCRSKKIKDLPDYGGQYGNFDNPYVESLVEISGGDKLVYQVLDES